MEQTGTCRHERKYRTTAGECRALRQRLRPVMHPFLHAAVDNGRIGGYNGHILYGGIHMMLDEKDLREVSALVDEKIDASEKRMSKVIDDRISASEERMSKVIDDRISASERRMQVMIENAVNPKFDLLMETLSTIQEQLVPRSRVDALEDEVKFLKVAVRQMGERVSQLEKAN